MSESASKSVLQKPPGYRDASVAAAPVRPPPRKVAQLPPALRHPGKPVHRGGQYRPRSRGRSLCRRLSCCLFLILFTLIFFTALAAGLCYLYFQPRVPSFRLQSLNVARFNVTTRPDGSGTFLDAAASVKIFAANPNARISLTYGEAEARMYIADDEGEGDDISMDSRRIPGFGQEGRNATVLKFATGAKSVLLVDDSVGARLRSRYRSREVRFGVEMRTGIGVAVRGRATRRVPVKVQCRPASLRQLSNKSGRTTLPRCDVYFFEWINLH